VLITGAGRRAGVATACAVAVARSGRDVGISNWRSYDRNQLLASRDDEPLELLEELRSLGARADVAEIDLDDPAGPSRLFEELEPRIGPFSALVAAHCRDLELPLMRTPADE